MESVVSYPERGRGGRSSYHGNCCPQIIGDFIDQFHVSELSDYMCGSGTTIDVCKEKGIISHCYDLNRGFNLLYHEIPEASNEAIWWHPPYWNMVEYSKTEYDSKAVERQYGFDPREGDISLIPDWDKFIHALNYCTLKQYASLEKGGHFGILMGDIKRKGRCYSMLLDMCKPGTLVNVVIKEQYNTRSERKTYSNRNFIPIVHEYLLILRKDGWVKCPVSFTEKKEADVRDLRCVRWVDVVREVMADAGRALTNAEIYSRVEGHRRCRENAHWKEKVRQTLSTHPDIFTPVETGVWKMAAAA